MKAISKHDQSHHKIQMMLEKIVEQNKPYYHQGQVATYIPALGRKNPEEAALSLVNIASGEVISAGDVKSRFTIQSISKVVTLILALMDNEHDYVFDRVGVEPTGDPFNSLLKLEIETEKPFNPLINAGAIAVTSMIRGDTLEEKYERMIALFRKLSGNPQMDINEEVYQSEKETGDRNRALAYYLKDNGIIEGNVQEVLDLYFRQCSIAATCQDIAMIGGVIANYGKHPVTGQQLVSKYITRVASSLMLTCGLYNESGQFSIQVGMPAKSGVGGGIMALSPGKFGIAAYGPALNDKGNSVVGIRMLRCLSQELGLHIFD